MIKRDIEKKILFKMKIFLKNPVLILKIRLWQQVTTLKFQLHELKMTKTHNNNLHILGFWIMMSRILIMIIIIHGGPSTRRLIFERLKYFLKPFLINIKSIQMIHKTFHLN